MSPAYYNENDKHAAAWLRNLIAAGHIAPGDVDERDIRDVCADDLRGYVQCHFFAGIGVWSHALRRAGWPDDRPVWTGSCPCQPFSAAGRGGGVADERHLWPHWFYLAEIVRPPVIFGEQVASKDGLGWFDLVSSDLEGAGYAVGAEDRCAAGYGAPHIRQRLFFGAYNLRLALPGIHDATGARCDAKREGSESKARDEAWLRGPERGRGAGRMVDSIVPRLEGHGRHGDGGDQSRRIEALADGSVAATGSSDRLADTDCQGGGRWGVCGSGEGVGAREGSPLERSKGLREDRRPGPLDGFWRDADWLFCRDGKWRPVEPGLEPLAHGAAGRVGRLRAYGNAIVSEVAEEFIRDFADAVAEIEAAAFRPTDVAPRGVINLEAWITAP